MSTKAIMHTKKKTKDIQETKNNLKTQMKLVYTNSRQKTLTKNKDRTFTGEMMTFMKRK